MGGRGELVQRYQRGTMMYLVSVYCPVVDWTHHQVETHHYYHWIVAVV